MQITNQQKQSKQLRKNKKTKNQIIEILPYENTYGQLYYPNPLTSIDQAMIDKIIHGVQAMAIALTNTVNKHQLTHLFIYKKGNIV